MTRIPATLLHSSITFWITPAFAEECLFHVGEVVCHEHLGPLRVEEIQIDPQTYLPMKVCFLGTSKRPFHFDG